MQAGRWFYIPDPDEPLMTFQIGMVGNDGILLASDQLATYSGNSYQYSDTSRMRKIAITQTGRIAYCCAGDRLSIVTGAAIANSIDQLDEYSASVKDCVVQAVYSSSTPVIAGECKQPDGNAEPLRGGSILVATCKPLGLWRIDVIPGKLPIVVPILDKAKIGDSNTAAPFFTESYYSNRPVEELLFLAAHTVLTAGAMSQWVKGLDIVLCKPSGCKMLTGQRIEELTLRSETLRSQISDWLFR
jgi:hypothetical protein